MNFPKLRRLVEDDLDSMMKKHKPVKSLVDSQDEKEHWKVGKVYSIGIPEDGRPNISMSEYVKCLGLEEENVESRIKWSAHVLILTGSKAGEKTIIDRIAIQRGDDIEMMKSPRAMDRAGVKNIIKKLEEQKAKLQTSIDNLTSVLK